MFADESGRDLHLDLISANFNFFFKRYTKVDIGVDFDDIHA